MSWPDIVFSEEEKIKFQRMALELEKRMAADSNKYKDLERFSEYPPLVEAIKLAKEKKISTPHTVPNTSYWYFETNLQDWIRAEGAGMLSTFLSAIEGFPYEYKDGDDQNERNPTN